jgi:hypothetical protein
VHRFDWPELGSIEIRDARDVTVHPIISVAKGLVEHVLLGAVLADVLLSLGQLPLHASAVQVDGGVAALVGKSGQGKSTLAAALEAQGAQIHSDDLLAVQPANLLVHYGLGRVKLNPDVLSQLGDAPASLPVVYAGIGKRSKLVQAPSDFGAKRLLAIYRIKDGPELRIAPADKRRALFDLFANCFRVEVAQHACGAKEILRRCALVLEHVDLFELYRPRTLEALPAVAQAVRNHAESLAPRLR